jgi:hypothetical protein
LSKNFVSLQPSLSSLPVGRAMPAQLPGTALVSNLLPGCHVREMHVMTSAAEPQKGAETMGYVEEIGHELFTRYLLPFEAISILILIAILGAVVLALGTFTKQVPGNVVTIPTQTPTSTPTPSPSPSPSPTPTPTPTPPARLPLSAQWIVGKGCRTARESPQPVPGQRRGHW